MPETTWGQHVADNEWSGPTENPKLLWRVLPLVVVAAVYGQTAGFAFINYDDNINVYANPLLSDLSPAGFARIWSESYEGLYIPLTYSLWALLAKLSVLFFGAGRQPDPHLFHAANIVVHGLNTLLVAALMRRLLRHEWAAMAGALLFALHPVQVEAVAWVTSMKDLFSGFFSLLALWWFVLFAQDEEGKGRAGRYAWGLICYGAALLAKPGAVVVPLLAAILGFFLLKLSLRQLAWMLGPWVAMAIPVAMITKFSQPETVAIFIPSWWQRLLVAGDAVSFYAGKLVFPWVLAPDYGRTPQVVVGEGLPYLTGLLPWLVGAGILARCRSRWILAGIGLPIVVLLPVSGILPFSYQAMSTVADRYLYLAMLGPACLAGWVLHRFRDRRFVWWCFALILALAVVRTLIQLPVWRNSFSFNTFALEENPRSWTAATNLGVVMMERQQVPEAIALYEKAVEMNPGYVTAYYNLGVARALLNQNEQAAAAYRKAIETGPYFFSSYNNLCNLYLTMGLGGQAVAVFQQAVKVFIDPALDPELVKGINPEGRSAVAADDSTRALLYNIAGRFTIEMNQPAEAIAYLSKAVALDPGLAEAFNNLGNAYAARGMGAEAIAAYSRTIELMPGSAGPYNNLCLLYNSLHRSAEAVTVCQQAIAKDAGYAEAYFNLGNAYQVLGRNEEAIKAYKQTLELDPGHLWAAYNAAGVFKAAGNHAEAISLYRYAIQLKPDFAEGYHSLGLLLNEEGEFDEAMEEWQRAVEIDPSFATAFLSLSRELLRRGDKEAAGKMYQQAKRLGATDSALEGVFPSPSQ